MVELTSRDRENLEGVHPDLVLVFSSTIPPYPVVCTSGVRTVEEQRVLLESGASTTMNSRHLTGHAFDFAVIIDGEMSEDMAHYKACWKAFKKTADTLGVAIEWGGSWRKPVDGTHIQLSWKAYPIAARQKTPENSKTIAGAALFPVAAYIPQIFAELKTLTNGLINMAGDIAQWIQFGAILVIAVLIILERVDKIKREGV